MCFWHFLVSRIFSSGRQSDNIEAWRLVHSSFQSRCSIFFKTHVEISNTFKNLGPRPQQSRLIQIGVPQKSCFRSLFWRKSLFWPISIQWTPPQYTLLESNGSHLSDRLAPTQKNWTCSTSEFLVVLWESYHHTTSHSVIWKLIEDLCCTNQPTEETNFLKAVILVTMFYLSGSF